MKKIFLSYCWHDHEAVNRLDNALVRFGIQITRDIRDLDYDANIHHFMDSISTYDKIILYVSDSYLRSVNCMYEVSQALKAPEKIVVIVHQGAKIFNQSDKEDIVNYWENAYSTLCEKNTDYYRQETEDTKIALDTITHFIDFLKQGNRMNDKTIDFCTLLNRLQVDVKYPTILTQHVYNWIANSQKAQLVDVLTLIDDLYRSTSIIFSEYPNIPNKENSYLFKAIEFLPNMNGINLIIKCTDIKSGEEVPFSYPRMVYIEENSMRSDVHSKFYFYCENPAKKQRFMELLERKQNLHLNCKDFSEDDQRLLSRGYIDVYRIIIRF